ncbi:FAD-binding oxidoreductase [Frondihabitans sp. PAMC 28766]|uniref:FAD-binding oxidoreductase n=1 Tax=Frondihabitans sp. PAMC 28766 TaxID=1795630 RepID=UPI000AFEBFD4|nr:FAD-binding oxidoreductase [Frondihabitans sp. PAMC 28766]
MTSEWRSGVCVAVRRETATARSVRLRVDGLGAPASGLGAPAAAGEAVVAGQHVDVRLTADDGYQAVRSYSLSATPQAGPFGRPLGAGEIEITVEEMPEGEVSPYLVEGIEPGDPVEIRGPVGGWFVWRDGDGGSVQLIGGGSGVAPLVAMLRARVAGGSTADFRLLYSVRSPEALYFGAELTALAELPGIAVDTVYTRTTPPGWSRSPGRIAAADLESLVQDPGLSPTVFVCGPNAFVASVTGLLLARGHAPAAIRTERFGGP